MVVRLTSCMIVVAFVCLLDCAFVQVGLMCAFMCVCVCLFDYVNACVVLLLCICMCGSVH